MNFGWAMRFYGETMGFSGGAMSFIVRVLMVRPCLNHEAAMDFDYGTMDCESFM